MQFEDYIYISYNTICCFADMELAYTGGAMTNTCFDRVCTRQGVSKSFFIHLLLSALVGQRVLCQTAD